MRGYTWDYIKSDLYRHYGKCDFFTFLKAYITNNIIRFQVAHRLCNAESAVKYLGYALWVLNRTKKHIFISRKTQIGYGLFIGHDLPTGIHSTAVIGDNFNIGQFTSIASNEGIAAQIGNNVYVGPNVVIVENVKIGNNVTIGAGSIVTKDIPDNATAAGNYAKVLNYDNPGKYIQNKWDVSNNRKPKNK